MTGGRTRLDLSFSLLARARTADHHHCAQQRARPPHTNASSQDTTGKQGKRSLLAGALLGLTRPPLGEASLTALPCRAPPRHFDPTMRWPSSLRGALSFGPADSHVLPVHKGASTSKSSPSAAETRLYLAEPPTWRARTSRNATVVNRATNIKVDRNVKYQLSSWRLRAAREFLAGIPQRDHCLRGTISFLTVPTASALHLRQDIVGRSPIRVGAKTSEHAGRRRIAGYTVSFDPGTFYQNPLAIRYMQRCIAQPTLLDSKPLIATSLTNSSVNGDQSERALRQRPESGSRPCKAERGDGPCDYLLQPFSVSSNPSNRRPALAPARVSSRCG
jgi:hypothetical protein